MAIIPASMRVVLLVGLFFVGCLHIAVMALPNWWWFDYADWVQDTSGVYGTNGGIFQYCQHYRTLIGGHYQCFNYGDTEAIEQNNGLLDTREGLMEMGHAWRATQVCTILALILSFPVAALIGVACKVQKKRQVMLVVSLLNLLQCFFMIGGVGSSHQWIQQPLCMECEWRDLFFYDYAFYMACSLIGGYMLLSLLAFWTSCMDGMEPEDPKQRQREKNAMRALDADEM